MRCNNGAATSLHFPVAMMPERNANRLAPATTEPGRDTAIPGEVLVMKISAAPRRFDRGDVDFLHAHHGIECALCFIAAGGHCLCQHARRNLPGDAPLVLAPAARTLLAPIADNGVPVAVGLLLIIGGDLKRESFVMLERGTAVEADTGDAATVNSTISTSPSLPDG
jgi:hypothetical protein